MIKNLINNEINIIGNHNLNKNNNLLLESSKLYKIATTNSILINSKIIDNDIPKQIISKHISPKISISNKINIKLKKNIELSNKKKNRKI